MMRLMRYLILFYAVFLGYLLQPIFKHNKLFTLVIVIAFIIYAEHLLNRLYKRRLK